VAMTDASPQADKNPVEDLIDLLDLEPLSRT
jgi:hypothetical protein